MEATDTLESNTLDVQSYYGAGHQNVFEAKKRMYAMTLEREAYTEWRKIDLYMRKRKQPTYSLVCEHDGPDYPHIHCLYQYDKPKIVNSKFLFGAHIETKVWSPQKYVEYCKGLDEKHKSLGVNSTVIWEEGELRKAGGARTIGDVKKMSRDEIDELPVQLQNIATKIIREEQSKQSFFDMLDQIEKDDLKGPTIIYITGMSGQGKTYNAYRLALKLFKKHEIGRISFNNNFATVDNEEAKCFVVEEFRPSQLHAADFLQFTDKYGYHVNIKGGSIYLRPQCIIICSIFEINDIYKDEINVQFQRRVSCVYQADEHVLIPCIDEPDILKSINDPALIRRDD